MTATAETPPGLSPQALVALHETAAAWFMRRHETSWTGSDERALNAWLAADPLHREVYDGMALTSHDLHQIPLAADRSWRAAAAPAAPAAFAAPAAPARRATSAKTDVRRARRGWARTLSTGFAAVAAFAVVALVGGYGLHRWADTATFTTEVATAHRETRRVDLPDGSHVALNTDSTLRVRYFPRRREVTLERGEAFFEVAPDTGRPFTVDSGASQVKVVGTAFNVRAAPPEIVVKVRSGRVEVRPDRDAREPQVLVLGPGAGVAIDPATRAHRGVPADAATVGDWRTGQIQFQRTPLGEVAQELSRYLGRPVVLASADLARQPISGVAATATPEAFLQALPGLLPLRVQQQPDGSWRIARK
ncbi:FecR domain-containing protein [Variovorax sp. J22G73]|uniref:FecR family protein n=1 Tax=unclassified Variovorax TaxID=663243 RepID=UPI0025755EEB|nr:MULTISPECIES: FecR domain-containing protein [unclassified Variovorax]MDM0007669.1 FecR domain-containing protein [Variovorax sp. J22R203]MDM0099971.1 FecR domain-containing protein [Variovorax sp. J22G73]